ncbi:hypothetical protein ACRS5L_25770 [Metapseudomonas otitidis]|uniref:hypothetical protein n=1 Tax=Metapseudomonas otitidis TaxID=319939 RepID=UPI003EE10D75
MSYQGILFPDRAEDIHQPSYNSYRIFLDFWQPLANKLRDLYEPVFLRGTTRILLIHAPQGGGKTMFATKLANDFKSTTNQKPITASKENLWHRISGGTDGYTAKLDENLINGATNTTSVINITNDSSVNGTLINEDKKWLTELIPKIESNTDRRWIVILDNAERGHFIQSLLDLSDAEFMERKDDKSTIQIAAQRFVGYARTKLRGCLFVILTNSQTFKEHLTEAINSQHRGMLEATSLPLPGAQEKETVVRVNTNRLNNFSYWYCLDKAGPNEKIAVYNALNGAETFPGSFAAVDAAIKSSTRVGRSANTCLLSLIIFTKDTDKSEIDKLGTIWREEINYKWLSVTTFNGGWATNIKNTREAALLESEWNLRVITIGEEFIKSLLTQTPRDLDLCSKLISRLKKNFGAGVHQKTLEQHRSEIRQLIDSWTINNNSDIETNFWSLGQRRSTIYEPILTKILNNYNKTSPGFLSCRPDTVISKFTPCSILSAKTSEIKDINRAIRREAHTFEFTAIQNPTAKNIQIYLEGKLKGYIEVVQEQ